MPPVDAAAKARERYDILVAVEAGATLEEVGVKPLTFYRWKRAYKKGGIKALETHYDNCGRPPMAKLDELEEITAKRLYLQTGSVTLALRTLASSEVCSEKTAAAILKKRASKHSIPRSLRHAVDPTAAVVAYHKSPKNCRTNFFINPRTLTYLTPSGEVPLRVGDLSERDDMSNNFLCWVDWPWGGDACSDRYGVRLARGQNLLQIDVRSLFFQSFCFLVRVKDSYRADDIWQWVGNSYRDHFVPAIGERWERGIWASNKLRGVAIEPGHTPNAERLGGLTALGRRVIESQSPTTKIIENRFNFFQSVCATIPGQIGRSRGEMERENKLWTECREGRRDPREHFLSIKQATEQIEKKLHFVNHEPVEGLLYQGIPAEIYQRGLAERDDLKPLAPEQNYLFQRDLKFTTCTKSHALVRFTRPDGQRGGWWFSSLALMKEEGQKLAVYFDSENPEAGATVLPLRGRRAGEAEVPRIACEYVDGAAQFSMSPEELSPEQASAYGRRAAFNNAVRSEYRALGFGQRIARRSQVKDGAGGEATVVDAPTVARRSTATPATAAKNRGEYEFNNDRLARLEKQFLEANPGVEIT